MTWRSTAELRAQLAGHPAGHSARHRQAARATGIARTWHGGRNANDSPATRTVRHAAPDVA